MSARAVRSHPAHSSNRAKMLHTPRKIRTSMLGSLVLLFICLGPTAVHATIVSQRSDTTNLQLASGIESQLHQLPDVFDGKKEFQKDRSRIGSSNDKSYLKRAVFRAPIRGGGGAGSAADDIQVGGGSQTGNQIPDNPYFGQTGSGGSTGGLGRTDSGGSTGGLGRTGSESGKKDGSDTELDPPDLGGGDDSGEKSAQPTPASRPITGVGNGSGGSSATPTLDMSRVTGRAEVVKIGWIQGVGVVAGTVVAGLMS
ncbi:hypothetical protein QBC43DRAFT_359629 [Cladorrhinum sp. PSN259]|nr:hypothetical protein QBC43DRAFT_359629 [Cladorrhinum sp. PSN259]